MFRPLQRTKYWNFRQEKQTLTNRASSLPHTSIMSYLQIGHTPWPWAEIRLAAPWVLQAAPDFGQEALSIAQRWLNGEVAFTLYTSGSTGAPKPIHFSRHQVEQSVWQTTEVLDLTPGSLLVNVLSPSYVAGFMMLMRSLENQMPLIHLQPSRQPLPDWLLNTPPAMMALVPLQLKAIVEASPAHRAFLSQVGAILIGGGPLSSRLADELQKLGATVYHTYGMTETLTHVAIRKISPEPWYAFQAMPNTRFQQDGLERLIIETPLWNEPVHTNDRVTLHDDQHFTWLGRADFVVNSGGVKIQIEHTEQQIRNLLNDHQLPFPSFFLTSLPDTTLGEKLILVLEGSEQLLQTYLTTLMEALHAYLPRYEVPKQVYSSPAFTYTHTGKLDRKATQAALGAAPASS